MHSEQEALLEKAVAGDGEALGTLLVNFHDDLLAFIRSDLHRQDVGESSPEDLLQETMMRAFLYIDCFENRGLRSFHSWLKSIASSTHANWVKARTAKKRTPEGTQIHNDHDADSTADSILQLLVGPDRKPSMIARRNEVLAALVIARTKLAHDRRWVIELRFVKGMTIEEIMAIMDRNESAVKMLISRSIQELRSILATDFGEFSVG